MTVPTLHLRVLVKLDMLLNLGIGEMSQKLCPFHRDRIALLSGHQIAESYLQNFVVVYSDPLHKEKVACFRRDKTASLSKHVATSHATIQNKMADKVQKVLERCKRALSKPSI